MAEMIAFPGTNEDDWMEPLERLFRQFPHLQIAASLDVLFLIYTFPSFIPCFTPQEKGFCGCLFGAQIWRTDGQGHIIADESKYTIEHLTVAGYPLPFDDTFRSVL